VPSRYAGRNQIPLYAAAGRRTETDGGSARYRGRGEGYSFRLGSIRNETRSRQGGSLRRNSDSCHSAETSGRSARNLACYSDREARCTSAEACGSRAHAMGFAHDREV
jgi:hypothetical protein